MNSTVTLYVSCKIRPNLLFKVDDIETYLATEEHYTITNFQYIRHKLNLKIKINQSQVYSDFAEQRVFNYCKIQNDGLGIVYYFIIGKTQLSEETIEYELAMDTINTFLPYADSYMLELSPKTKITRQHKDRYEIKQVGQQNGIYKKIDLYSEGIAPVLFGEEKNELRDEIDVNWYLIYMNQNDPSDSLNNPVNCFIASDTYLNVANENFNGVDDFGLTIGQIKQWLQNNRPNSLYFIGANNKGAHCGQTIMTENNMLEWYLVNNGGVDEVWERYTENGVTSVTRYDSESDPLVMLFADATTLQYGSADNRSATARTYSPAPNLPTSMNVWTICGINELDKTDPKIIKILKLPYSPVDFDFLAPSGVVDVSTGRIIFQSWQFSTPLEQPSYRRLQLLDLNTKFERTIDFEKDGSFNPYEVLKGKPIIPRPNITDLRNADNEPKLYHSDFYMPKVIYDSFSFGFQLERVTHQFGQTQPRFNVKYLVSSTINSRFSFTFNDYECSPYNAQDYNNVMCVSRNNEVPIYNQQYINYLRAGFNYDVKSKTRTETFSWIATGLQLLGAVGSFASSAYTGGVGIAAGVALTTTALGSLASSINTTITAEQNFAAKQEQLKLQATSVYGSDDVDLMSGYSNNRAKIMLYKVSPKMKGLLFDLFHYTGYVADEMGVPNVKTRCRFNFVACEPIYKEVPNIPQDLLEDLNNKLRAGVTFIHHFNNEWDFEQKYENWEVSLLGE